MEANELMIGDWVKFADNVDWADGLNGKPVQVEGLRDDDGAIKVYDPRPNSEFRDFWSDDEDDFEPIPLSAEILEKSFQGADENLVGWWANGDGYWIIDVDFQVNLKLHYVHELQHALRLAGIEKEIVL